MLRRITTLVCVALLGMSSLARASGPTFAPATRLLGSVGDTEPRLAVGPDGTRWVVSSDQNNRLIVYRSPNGIDWTAVAQPSPQNQATIDVDVAVTRTGRVIVTELDLVGVQTRVYYSDNNGTSWTASVLGGLVDQDRQWLAVGPDDPVTHLPRVYFLWHNLASGVVNHNMWVATSVDNGATFLPPVPITTPGSQAWLDLQCSDSGGPEALWVDKTSGRLYASWGVRTSLAGGCAAQPFQFNIVFATRIWAATSPDGSAGSWTVSLGVDESASGRMVELQGSVSTIDSAGNMYLVYTPTPNPFPDFTGSSLTYRWAPPDLSHWSDPIDLVAPGGAGNIHPHPIGGAPGKLDIAWYAGSVVGANIQWTTTVAQVTGALTGSPTMTTTALSTVPAYVGTAATLLGHCGDGATAGIQDGLLCGRATDVWGVALDPDCDLLVAWPSVGNVVPGSRNATWVSAQTGGDTIC